MDRYKPTKRYHEVNWMLIHSEDLESKAKRQRDSSKLIYCCLELRNAIEMLDFHLILASVPNSEHQKIAEMAKPYLGNERVNNKLKSLKEKTQKFYECVCEAVGIPGKFYDYRKSNEIRFELSQYIHTYTRKPSEMNFESSFIQAAFPIILKAREFVKNSLINDGENYIVQNIDFTSLSPEDKELLFDWKQDKIDEGTLRIRILQNIENRKNSSQHSTGALPAD